MKLGKIETWYEIPGFKNYFITVGGKVKKECKKRGKLKVIILKQTIRAGYQSLKLQKEKKTVTTYVHILLALVFLKKIEGKKFVNHKDGNKLNNKISNLEYVTHQENIAHAYKIGLIKNKAKPVLDTCSGIIYKNSKEAALVYQIPYNTLRGYLNGQIKRNPTCLKYKEAA